MRVLAAGRQFEVEAIVFDKDGTLIDLHSSWFRPARALIEEASGRDPVLAGTLERELGLEPDRLTPDGPLATASLENLAEMTAGILEREGLGDEMATARARWACSAAQSMAAALPLLALGDVLGTMRRLSGAGLHLAVLTTDGQESTMSALAHLGILGLIDAVVTADGDLPPKPDPAGFHAIATQLGVLPRSMLMVGDSGVDSTTAAAAGAAGFVLISPDPRPIGADAVVASIEELSVHPPGGIDG